MDNARNAASAVLLLIFSVAVQGCGTDVLPGADSGIDGTTGGQCPAVPCAEDESCVAGACVVIEGCVDEDGDGFGIGCEPGDDCDDADGERFPGALEECNDKDDDCDFFTDEDGVCNPCVPTCTPGASECSGERIVRCDDTSGCASWASPATCPGGLACAGGECVETCADVDGDGFPATCPGEREDCDDSNANTFPRAAELCDTEDNDCDGTADEGGVCDNPCEEDECVVGSVVCSSDGSAVIACINGGNGCAQFDSPRLCGSSSSCVDGVCVDTVVCIDPDSDGHGPGCDLGGDCRGADPLSYDGATEVCDGVDNDCDGLADNGGVCSSCTAAPAGSPISLAGGSAYRVSCGGLEHFSIPSTDGPVSVVVASVDGRLGAELGTISGGTFSSLVSGSDLGIGVTLLGSPGAGAAVRVNAPAGTAYVVAYASSSGCPADPLEPNNAPAAGTAAGRLPFAAGATICGSDTDFFEVEITPGQILSVAAAFEGSSSGDILPKIWRNGAEVSISSPGPFVGGFANGRHTHFRTDLPGTYVVGVRGRIASVQNEYALAITTHTDGCRDDAGETTDGLDDDTLGTARPLAAGGSYDGILCAGDIDVISVGRLNEGQSYGGTLTVASDLTDIDFLVVRDSLRSVFHDGIEDGEVTTFLSNVSTAGDFYVVIFGRDPYVSGAYTYAQTGR